MRRGAVRTALAMEMNLLLGPLSLAVLCALTTGVALGFPYAFKVVIGPTGHHDAATLAFLAAILLSWYMVWIAWSLGTLTIRGERFEFGAGFWLALLGSAAAAALAMHYTTRFAIYAIAPVWLFTAHMALLQSRLRSSTRSAS